MGVIFVAGVHAVGKTTACAHVSGASGIAHYSASALIKTERASAISNQGKAVADVEGNQALLIRAVKKAAMRHDGRMILDGHFTLVTRDLAIERVSVEVFRAFGLRSIVVFHDQPVAIADRLRERDGVRPDIEHIALHQEAELNHARQVSAELAVPLVLSPAFDSTALLSSVREWL